MRWLLLALVLPGALGAQDKKNPLVGPIEYLWPKGAPLATGEGDKDKPNISVYLAPEDKATGAAVVVCPGGGYGALATGHEGHDVAVFFNNIGVSAFVLTYRLAPKYHHPCMMLDVQRAIRTVRARASEWKVDKERIGVMGFSAGGHLASTAVTYFDDGKAEAEDAIDKVGCRPDFGILIYPVIVLDKTYTHQGSKKNLLGNKVGDAELVDDLSTEKRVTPKTPPCFLMHTSGDTGVPPENSIDFYLALRKAKVPAELHIFEKGGHGFGLAPNDPILRAWPDRMVAWMTSRGYLKKG
ncbi:MAG: alpha/beta hydrolase [Planctomycetes bacterium]|nr:alpha/beta hydrolase [Planctomycetota bacterium]